MKRFIRTVPGALLLILTALQLATAQQNFTKGDSASFIIHCHTALEDYVSSLNAAGFYCQSQGEFNSKQQVLIAQSFLGKDVFVYSDLASEPYPIEQYSQQFRLYKGNAEVNLDQEKYVLSQNKTGKPVLIVYVTQTTEFEKPGTSRTKRTTPLAIHFAFDFKPEATGFEPQNYRIVRIEKADAIPARAVPFPAGVNLIALRERERSLSWATYRLAKSIAETLPDKKRAVVIRKFSYENSQLTNAFSDQLADELRHRLKTDQGIRVVADETSQEQGIRGSYRERGGQVEITAELFEVGTDKSVTKLKPNLDLPTVWVQQKGLKLKPEDNDAAIATQQAIVVDAPAPAEAAKPEALLVTMTASGKTRKNLEFWENDTMTVRVRANKPCHVRLVYVQSNGEIAMLWKDLEIKAGEENKDIVFPEQFKCIPPFGQETLIAAASTSRFCPIETKENEHGAEIIVGSMKDALKNMRCVDRGFTRIPQLAETRLVLTTRGSNLMSQK
ncbi:DUF4384 domain-containing protein [Larkinella rosea]|uniref:DUF4384 domain-containing protein n=1 Tax=Larkinella rosea TaxID=2025312 RepID=A0A3P1BGU3_9BACT|nr:DUF4384 domain-containing protein [Larkinella rosea]RRB00103.1 DUF4384 domain-containing protein [Larkinella rosea]